MLKGAGGSLSVVASGYGAQLDWGDSAKLKKQGDYRLASMYFVRGSFQALSALITALTTFSYCSPLIETFGIRFGKRLVGRLALAAAQRFLLMRAALMLASIEVAIFVLLVTLVIWYFEDDALQKWCQRCAFGLERMQTSDRYIKADDQLKAFDEALTGVR